MLPNLMNPCLDMLSTTMIKRESIVHGNVMDLKLVQAKHCAGKQGIFKRKAINKSQNKHKKSMHSIH